jgi:uncharacterized membrane protein
MESTARIAGHPVHPMLIPYPFALLTGAMGFDLIARLSGRRTFEQTASHLNTAGIFAALVAAVPGIIDYFGTVPRGSEAKRDATWHAALNLSALALFTMARARRGADGRARGSVLPLEVLGSALMSAAGLLGGTLVYHHHIGMERGDHPQLGAGATQVIEPTAPV